MSNYLDYDGLSHFKDKLDAKFAPLASPALSGTPTAPTAAAGTSNEQIATTGFVANAIVTVADHDTTYTLGTTGSGSSRKVTLTAGGSGSGTQEVAVPDTDTTYSDFAGATSSAAGAHGLVPAPPAWAGGQYPRALLANGWQSLNLTTVPNTSTGKLSIALESPSSSLFLGAAEELPVATASVNGLMSKDDKTKLDGMTAGAEPNQNAFSKVFVADTYDNNGTTIEADTETDTIGITGESQIQLVASAATDIFSIAYRPNIYYATCETAAGTAAKVATLNNPNGFELAAGVVVAVTFKYGNSASTPTLNVNSTGAKTIAVAKDATTYQTGDGTTYNTWGAYETVLFTYTGTYWAHLPSGRLGYLAYSGLSSKANTASPTLTGTPKAPTATAGTNTTQIATTEFVTTAVGNAVSGMYKYKGSVASASNLPTSGQTTGDVYNIESASTYGGAGMNVAWNGTAWDPLGEIFSITAITNAQIDALF